MTRRTPHRETPAWQRDRRPEPLRPLERLAAQIRDLAPGSRVDCSDRLAYATAPGADAAMWMLTTVGQPYGDVAAQPVNGYHHEPLAGSPSALAPLIAATLNS